VDTSAEGCQTYAVLVFLVSDRLYVLSPVLSAKLSAKVPRRSRFLLFVSAITFRSPASSTATRCDFSYRSCGTRTKEFQDGLGDNSTARSEIFGSGCTKGHENRHLTKER